MYDKVVFYNQWGAGDIFESREFVKDIADQMPAKEYYYSHNKSHRILLDLPFLKQENETIRWANMRKATFGQDNNYYINTWIGRDGQYVLPGVGCTIEQLYRMYHDMRVVLREDTYSYIPTIDFSYYKTDTINEHIKKYKSNKKILLCNGRVHSVQAANFDFAPVIKKLSETYPNVIFYITEGILDYSLPENVFLTSELIGNLEFDLNEIGYLSTFCNLIIGRCSGPSVFAMHKPNCIDPNKASLGFTYTYQGSHFVLNDGMPMKKYWSPVIYPDEVYTKIVEVMNERNIS